MDEIRVFMEPMDDDPLFHFQILQMSGGDSKSLSVHQVSASFRSTASVVSGKMW